MTLTRYWGPAGIGLVVGTASAAWAWQDCVLLAASMVLAYRLFLLRMDRGTPWRAVPAAFNVLSAGVLVSGAGLALMAGIGAAWLQWWQPHPDHPVAVPFMVFACAGLCCLGKRSPEGALAEARPWLWLASGVLLAVEAQRSGMPLAPCLLVLVVGAVLLREGWRLATLSAPALLRAGGTSR